MKRECVNTLSGIRRFKGGRLLRFLIILMQLKKVTHRFAVWALLFSIIRADISYQYHYQRQQTY